MAKRKTAKETREKNNERVRRYRGRLNQEGKRQVTITLRKETLGKVEEARELMELSMSKMINFALELFFRRVWPHISEPKLQQASTQPPPPEQTPPSDGQPLSTPIQVVL